MKIIDHIIDEAWLKFENGEFLFTNGDENGVTFVKLKVVISAISATRWAPCEFYISRTGPCLSDVEHWTDIFANVSPKLYQSALDLAHSEGERRYIEDTISQEFDE